MPLIDAGFYKSIIPTSNKEECDCRRPSICKSEGCPQNSVWCPITSDAPKEQIEILFNFTTDIHMLETQGRVFTNETVIHFLFQYMNESGNLISQIFRTASKNSSVINKFVFEPPLLTNYIRITPIEYELGIAMRFEVYSKGILYKPLK